MAKFLQFISIMHGVPVASLVTISVECLSIDCSDEMTQVLAPELVEKIMNSIKISKSAYKEKNDYL